VKLDNSCFYSESQNNLRWAVYLDSAVVGILFASEGCCDKVYLVCHLVGLLASAISFFQRVWSDCAFYISGYRSDNFIIGLTDVSPATTAPTLWNYDLCARYPGAVADGATVSLTCTSNMPARRYLIVQVELINQALNFCELEVYVRRKLSFMSFLQRAQCLHCKRCISYGNSVRLSVRHTPVSCQNDGT